MKLISLIIICSFLLTIQTITARENSAQDERHTTSVQISVKVNISETFPLTTTDNLLQFHKLVKQLNSRIELIISENSSYFTSVYIKRNKYLNSRGLTPRLFINRAGKIIRVNKPIQNLSYCYFIGSDTTNSLITSISICNGVQGIVHINNAQYEITPIFNGTKVSHSLIYKHGYLNMSGGNEERLYRQIRELRLPATHNSNSRYIEMYLVADNSFYNKTRNLNATFRKVADIVNYCSALYARLNMYIALVGVDIWIDRDQIEYYRNGTTNTAQVDSNLLLGNFRQYRQREIIGYKAHDTALLLTDLYFAGGAKGRAHVKKICSRQWSCGVIHNENAGFQYTSVILAHELGHIIGVSHVTGTRQCNCYTFSEYWRKSYYCIMNSRVSVSISAYDKSWSECTKRDFRLLLEESHTSCLKNVPEQLDRDLHPVCGNFFVEEGEECDCGPESSCTSKCCDPMTCTLYSNASCATGRCCDLNTCTIRSNEYKCRPIQDSECDLEEFCDGRSEWCPSDKYKQDGTPCYNRGDAFCYEGRCNSHTSQCVYIYKGRQHARNGEDICYRTFNNRSRADGNCGFDWVKNAHSDKYTKRYHQCVEDRDLFCGLLQCQYDTHALNDWRDYIGIDYPPKTDFNPRLLRPDLCAMVIYENGHYSYKPGQVPNGAKCAPNSMCVNSRCQLIEHLVSISSRSTSAAATNHSTTVNPSIADASITPTTTSTIPTTSTSPTTTSATPTTTSTTPTATSTTSTTTNTTPTTISTTPITASTIPTTNSTLNAHSSFTRDSIPPVNTHTINILTTNVCNKVFTYTGKTYLLALLIFHLL